MRNCPICESSNKKTDWKQDFLTPTGFTLPKYFYRYLCLDCGMIYADSSEMSQDKYDIYYKEKYGYGDVTNYTNKKMNEFFEIIKNYKIPHNSCIVDFGGGKSGLIDILKENKYKNSWNIEVDDILPNDIDVLFMSSVLEHLYDVPKIMNKISKKMKDNSILIIDGPDAKLMSIAQKSPMIDYQRIHINHFKLSDYINLGHKYGFEYQNNSSYEDGIYICSRIIFTKNKIDYIYNKSKDFVKQNIISKSNQLKELGNKPIIIWGCGDYALHVLSLYFPNVKYFVNKDPSFMKCKIKNIDVYDNVFTNDPIVIIAQGQKQDILNNIKELNLKNEVIII